MNTRLKNLLITLPIIFTSLFGMLFIAPMPVAADDSVPLGICTFIKPICQAINPNGGGNTINFSSAKDFLQQRLNVILSIVFIGIILISVFIILRAGIKYIQSQGDPGKIAEAQKAITSVFVGIAILFVGIIGLILVLAFFNLSGLTDTQNCKFNTDNGKVECVTTVGAAHAATV